MSQAQPIAWKSFLYEVSSESVSDDHALELEKVVAKQLAQQLSDIDFRLLGAHSVFQAICAAELNQSFSYLDVDNESSRRALVSLNNVLHLAPPTAAAALAQHGLVEGEGDVSYLAPF